MREECVIPAQAGILGKEDTAGRHELPPSAGAMSRRSS